MGSFRGLGGLEGPRFERGTLEPLTGVRLDHDILINRGDLFRTFPPGDRRSRLFPQLNTVPPAIIGAILIKICMVIARNVEILLATEMSQVGRRMPQLVVHLLEDFRLEAGEDLLIFLFLAAAWLRLSSSTAGHILDGLRQADAGAALPVQGENIGKVLIGGTSVLVITDSLANHLIRLILALLATRHISRFRPILDINSRIIGEDIYARPGPTSRPRRVQRGYAALALDVALLRVGLRRDHGGRVARDGGNGIVSCCSLAVV